MTAMTAMIVSLGMALGGGVLFLDGMVRVLRSGRFGDRQAAEEGGDKLRFGTVAFYLALLWAGVATVLQ